MVLLFVCLQLFQLCLAQVYVWMTNSPVSISSGIPSLDSQCSGVVNSRALICSASLNVSDLFSEAQSVYTRDTAGAGWDSTAVATAGTVRQQLFTSPSSLAVAIRAFDGTAPSPNPQIATSCNPDGTVISALSCSGYYTNSSSNTMCTTPGSTTNWLGGNAGPSCSGTYRIYCVGGYYVGAPSPAPTAAPTRTPTVAPTATPTAAPTRTPTAAPTAAPTRTPTAAPTVAPTPAPTAAPTPTRTPTAAPTRLPTAVAPAVGVPTEAPTRAPTAAPTIAPTTAAPTVAGTTLAPTNTPAPSLAPSAMPTFTPTKAPTCATCTGTISPGSNSSNTTIIVGPPGGGVVITVPPTAVPNCSNCSVLIVVTPTPSGPPGGIGIISVDVLDEDGLMRDNVTLNVPISFLMPYSSGLRQCTEAVNGKCVWWDGSSWLTSGCTSEAMATGTLCTCSHLTDFAVLLDESAPFACVREGSVEVYYAFTACYAVLFVYCALVMCHLLRSSKQSRSAMLWPHCLIGLVSVLRILSCLNYAKVFGDTLGLSAFVAAAPYPLEYLLFTKFASTWAGVVHFSMLGSEARWKKIRPLFYGINVIGTGLAVALFVLFYVQASFESALAGTIVLASLYLALAIVFNVYATLLVKELTKVKTSSSSSVARRDPCCGVSGKIRWLGRSATVCFVVQALCSVLALVTPSDELVGWTAVFLLFNVLALFCILLVYSAAVLKANKTSVAQHEGSSAGSSRTLYSAKSTEMT